MRIVQAFSCTNISASVTQPQNAIDCSQLVRKFLRYLRNSLTAKILNQIMFWQRYLIQNVIYLSELFEVTALSP